MEIVEFYEEAESILALQVDHRVGVIGGYGSDGEVIYENHPVGRRMPVSVGGEAWEYDSSINVKWFL